MTLPAQRAWTWIRVGARGLVDAMLSVLLAPACAACEAPLDRPTRGPVCGACWNTVRVVSPPLCDACGDGLPSWRVASQMASLCTRCRRRPSPIARARAAGEYEGSLRGIIHAFKYGGRRSLAAPLGRLMLDRCADVLDGADCLVPVPLHPRRWRARGFNQAADLARTLPLPVVDALARTRATRSQTDLPAARRHGNVRGAFAPAGSPNRRASARLVRHRCVVLIDDVTTTGATLQACAAVLRAAGAREVRALTVARAAIGRAGPPRLRPRRDPVPPPPGPTPARPPGECSSP